MKKHLSIQKTVKPLGYNGRNFNAWARHIARQLDKIKGTSVADNYKVN